MNEYEEYDKEINFLDKTRMTYKQFYNDLSKAMDSNNLQSLWRLSKTITKYHIDI